MQDYSGNAPSLRSQFAVALTFSMALPIIAIGGLAFAVWRNVRFSPVLDQPHIVYFSAAAGAIVLIVLVTTLAWNRMWRTLRARVEAMSATCRSVAEGGLDERVPVIGDDMLAGLSASVNAVLDTFQNNPNGQDTATLQGQIEKLLQQVSAVGDGDLRVQADVTPDTLGVLANSFNYMIEELVKVVSRVQSTTQQVTSSTRRILDRSRDLSRSAEAQRQQMMQASEQVEALAAFMLSVGRNAMISASASQETLTSSREGLAAVSATIEGMQHIRENVQETSKKIKRLGERSQEISDIVRAIEELADQTNLLALNAALQSTVGGEGRGFTVVADEIRLLAERSGEAAKRIVAQVKSIQSETQDVIQAMEESTAEVVRGSAMADNAERALQTIYTAVENQATMIQDIATSADSHSHISEAAAAAMSQVARLSQQTNAIMQEAVTSISYLADQADQLRASVAAFKLPSQAMGQPQSLGGPMGQPLLGQQPPPRPDLRAGGYYPPPFPQGEMPALPPGFGTGSIGHTGAMPTQRGGPPSPSRPYGPPPGPPANAPMNGQPPPGFDPWSTSQDDTQERPQR